MHAGQTQFVLQQLRRAARPELEAGDGELLDAFVLHRDEAAFAALLRRHGPMVWGVCRRLAGQIPDAEDAFQAVFLILVRKAGGVRPRERVGAWLHGVAFRTARKARRLAERRQAREKQVEQVERPAPETSAPDADLLRVVDEELHRLPERLRLPVLLCDVQGRPQRDVARQLAVPVGTLGHRLDSARRILARRLTRRGVTLSLALLATAAVPGSLNAVTRRAALALAAGRDLGALVPPQIVALTEGALTMTRSKFRLAAALVLVAVLGGFGLHATQRPGLIAGENEPVKAPPAAKPAEAPVDDATFLRRLSLDLRGTLPTILEMNYFLADKDAGKRRKVAGWMLEPAAGKSLTMTDVGLQALAKAQEEQLSEARKVMSDRAYREYLEKIKPDQPSRPAESKPEPRKKELPPAGKPVRVEDLLKQVLDEVGKPVDPTKPADAERRRALLDSLYDMIAQPPPLPDDAVQRQQLKKTIDRAIEFLGRQQAKQEHDAVQQLLDRYMSSSGFLSRMALKEAGVEPPTSPTAERAADDLALQLWLMNQKTQDGSTDAEFLRRLMLDLTGTPPTTVEVNYFVADKDPNKRQKVTEWLMKNPEVAKKLDNWKKAYARSQSPAGGDRFEKLLAELLAGSRSDEQVLEALTLATLARFPTDSERQFLGVYLKSNGDRRAAWSNVLYVLTNTQEFRQHAASLQSRTK
jgi:RNA polymerase sigma factor (sigma-70 family)